MKCPMCDEDGKEFGNDLALANHIYATNDTYHNDEYAHKFAKKLKDKERLMEFEGLVRCGNCDVVWHLEDQCLTEEEGIEKETVPIDHKDVFVTKKNRRLCIHVIPSANIGKEGFEATPACGNSDFALARVINESGYQGKDWDEVEWENLCKNCKNQLQRYRL